MINKVLISSLHRIDNKDDIKPGVLVEHVRVKQTIGIVIECCEGQCMVCWAVAPEWWESMCNRYRPVNHETLPVVGCNL